MLTLCGFAVSNYYNKVKLALLEKRLPFEELLRWPDQTDGEISPLHRVPYLKNGDLGMCESQVIIDYLEARYPEHPLVLADPFQTAKAREVATFLELHLGSAARQLFPEAFSGGKISDNLKIKVHKRLRRNIPAAARLFKLSPHAAGNTFTIAGCAAIVHFPPVNQATRTIYGKDLSAQVKGVKPYLAKVAGNPSMQKVRAGSKTNLEQVFAHYANKR